jgi:transposase-like protein
MVTITVLCQHCQSQNIIRYGRAPNGKQRYLCRHCGRRRRNHPTSTAYSAEERELILRAYDERSSLCGLTRTFGVARNTVTEWVKKKSRVTAIEGDAC